jgi:hypothetical protein
VKKLIVGLCLGGLIGCAGLSMKDTCRYCVLSSGARYAEAGYPVEVMRCNRQGQDHAIARAWKDGKWAYLYCAGNGDPLESKSPNCSEQGAYYLRFDEYVLQMMSFYHWDRTRNF